MGEKVITPKKFMHVESFLIFFNLESILIRLANRTVDKLLCDKYVVIIV
jgi:hypothetical protein